MFDFEFLIYILTPLIVLHEAGHYLWARRFGVPVRRASLFFNIGKVGLQFTACQQICVKHSLVFTDIP